MTFLNLGLFAAGAAAVSIPIIIHFLFRRRRKPVVWAAMRFLIEAYKKHQRRLKLEQWLLLATRCLLLLLIALALGRPVAESAAQALGLGGGRTVYFLIDNSLASSARDVSGDGQSALDRHKAAAAELVDALGPGDRAALVALASPAQPIVLPASADLGAVMALINDLESADSGADFAGAFSALARELRNDTERTGQAVIVTLSDFRAGSADLSRPLDAVLADVPRVKLSASRPAGALLGNVQTVSADPLRRIVLTRDASGAANVDVRIKLRRTGDIVGQAGVSSVRLSVERFDEVAPSLTSSQVAWRAGQSEADLVLSAQANDLDGSADAAILVSIDRDAIEGDNQYRRPVQVRSAVRVGVAARRRFGAMPSPDALAPEDWLRLALSPTSADPIDVIDVDPSAIDAPTLAGLDAIVLPRPDALDAPAWRRIGDFARSGGLVLVSPPTTEAVHLWTDTMMSSLALPWRIAREVESLDPALTLGGEQPRSALLELIQSELPELARSVTVTHVLPVIEGDNAPETRVLLQMSDGAPWMLASPPGELNGEDEENASSSRGLVVYLTSAPALTWTDLPARPLIVPLLQELIRQGVGEATGGGVFTAGERPGTPPRTAELVPLNEDGPQERIGVTSGAVASTPIRDAGMWRAVDQQGASRGLVAVNAAMNAGRTETQTASAVRDWLLGSGVASDQFAWIADTTGDRVAGAITQSADAGSWLSYPLLVAAALVALLELTLARLFSHASIKPAGAGEGAPA